MPNVFDLARKLEAERGEDWYLDYLEKKAEVAAAKPEPEPLPGPTVGERAQSVGLSLLEGAQRVVKLPFDVLQVAGDPLGIGSAGSDFFQRGIDATGQLKPEASQRDLQNEIIGEDANGNVTFNAPNLTQITDTIAGSLPQIPALVAGGAALGATKVAQGAGGFLARAAGLKSAKAAEAAAQGLGLGVANATAVAPAAFDSTRREALAGGATEDEAREAGYTTAGIVAPVSLATGALGLGLAKALGEGRSILGGFARGAAADAPFEAVEEGAESLATDKGLDRPLNVTAAANAGALGAVAGGVTGGVVGGVSARSDALAQTLERAKADKAAADERRNLLANARGLTTGVPFAQPDGTVTATLPNGIEGTAINPEVEAFLAEQARLNQEAFARANARDGERPQFTPADPTAAALGGLQGDIDQLGGKPRTTLPEGYFEAEKLPALETPTNTQTTPEISDAELAGAGVDTSALGELTPPGTPKELPPSAERRRASPEFEQQIAGITPNPDAKIELPPPPDTTDAEQDIRAQAKRFRDEADDRRGAELSRRAKGGGLLNTAERGALIAYEDRQSKKTGPSVITSEAAEPDFTSDEPIFVPPASRARDEKTQAKREKAVAEGKIVADYSRFGIETKGLRSIVRGTREELAPLFDDLGIGKYDETAGGFTFPKGERKNVLGVLKIAQAARDDFLATYDALEQERGRKLADEQAKSERKITTDKSGVVREQMLFSRGDSAPEITPEEEQQAEVEFSELMQARQQSYRGYRDAIDDAAKTAPRADVVDAINSKEPQATLESLGVPTEVATRLLAASDLSNQQFNKISELRPKLPLTNPASTRRQANFDKFIDGSQQVNKDGSPKDFYHGTAADIRAFRAKQAGAIFVTRDPDFADSFSDASEHYMRKNYKDFLTPEKIAEAKAATDKKIEAMIKREPDSAGDILDAMYDDTFDDEIGKRLPTGRNILKVNVNTKNAFDYNNEQQVAEVVRAVNEIRKSEGKPDLPADEVDAISRGAWDYIEAPIVQKAIKSLGHDGFYVSEGGEKNLAVYKSSQIKSATGNRGTFDPAEDNIDFARDTANPPAPAAAAPKSSGLTTKQVRAKLVSRFGEATVKELESTGVLRLFETQNEAAPGAEGRVQGAANKATGRGLLVAENLTDNEVVGVTLHEIGGHLGIDEILEGDLDSLDARLSSLRTKSDADADIVAEADARVETEIKLRASEGGKLTAAQAKSERVAYTVQIAANKIANGETVSLGMRGFVRDFIAKVKAWLLTQDGLLKMPKLARQSVINSLTTEDLVALAVQATKITARRASSNYNKATQAGAVNEQQAITASRETAEPRDGREAGDGRGRLRAGRSEGGAVSSSERAVQEDERSEGRAEKAQVAPLAGAPKIEGATGPTASIVNAAKAYAKSRGITLARQASYAKVDPDRGARISEAYLAMENAPNDPEVQAAYAAMIEQTRAQYQALVDAGHKFWFIDASTDAGRAYSSTPWNAMRDVRANQSMGVFPTESGYGSSDAELDVKQNPLLAQSDVEWPFGSPDGPMKRVLANDLFRAVHDAFGHGIEGAGFRADGEENAWQAHARLYTGAAAGAMASETRGQNSWLNYNKGLLRDSPLGEQRAKELHPDNWRTITVGEHNRTATTDDTIFADQKIGLMPSWTWEEGALPDEDAESFSRGKAASQPPAKQTLTAAFKKWFGGSKLVDANGEPRKLYHGTKRNVDAFKTKYADGLIFFSTNPEFASKWPLGSDSNPDGLRAAPPGAEAEYQRMSKRERELREKLGRDSYDKADGSFDVDAYDSDRAKIKQAFRDEEGVDSAVGMYEAAGVRVMPVYLRSEKPFDPRADWKKIEAFLKTIPSLSSVVADGMHKNGNWLIYENKAVIDELKSMGYDGIWLSENVNGPHETFAVFSPSQIKSATGNNGDFNPADDRIQFSRSAAATFPSAPRPAPAQSEFADENRRLREKHLPLVERAKKRFKQYLTAEGLLPGSVYAENLVREQTLRADDFNSQTEIAIFDRVVEEAFGKKFDALDKPTQSKLTEGLAGRLAADLPGPVREQLIVMRQGIDALSSEYIDILNAQSDELNALSAEPEIAAAQKKVTDARAELKRQLDASADPVLIAARAASKSATSALTAANKADDGSLRSRNEIRAAEKVKAAAKEALTRAMSRDQRRAQRAVSVAAGELSDLRTAKGQAAGNDSRAETIAANIGQYVNRSYRAFDDAKWFENVPEEVLNNARRYLIDRYVEAGETLAEANRLSDRAVNKIVKTGTAYGSLEGFASGGKMGEKDLSMFIQRKEIAEPIRALLGEYTDPRMNYAKTITKMTKLVANTRFLGRVRELGMGSFLFEEGNAPADATEQLAGEASSTYAPLNGLWVTPEVKAAFEASNEKIDGVMGKILAVNGAIKFGKTVLSPTTAARNFMSSFFFSVVNGHFDLGKAKDAAALARSLRGKGTRFDQAYLSKLTKMGVIGDGANINEIERLMNDATVISDFFEQKAGMVYRSGKKVTDFATSFYKFGDDYWKIIGFENEKAGWMEAGLSEVEAEAKAAERIVNTYPTYSKQGSFVRGLARVPIVASFPTFTAEIIRTSKNVVRYIAEDIKSDNPKIQAMGYRRAIGLAAVSGLFYAASAITRSMYGVDDDEEEAIRDLAPPWQTNSTYLYAGRDEKGKLRYFDLTFLDPYGWYKRPVEALMRDQPWEDKLKSGMKDLLSPFLSEDIGFSVVTDVIANRKATGGEIYLETDSPISQGKDILAHVTRQLAPGFATNTLRTYEAAIGEYNRAGQQRQMGDELLGWVGWRVSTFNPESALYYKTFEFSDALKESTRDLNRTLRDYNEVSEEDVMSSVDAAQKKRVDAFRAMTRIVNASRKAGLTDEQIAQTLKLNGVSMDNARGLVRGIIPAASVGAASSKKAIALASRNRDPEFGLEVRNRYNLARQRQREIGAVEEDADEADDGTNN